MAGENFGRDELRKIVARVEELEEEKRALADDIKAVYATAKSQGFHPPVIREVVKLRRLDQARRAENEAQLELYLGAMEDLK